MDRTGFFYNEVLPFAGLVMVECVNVGSSTIYKAAVAKGLSYQVFVVYSYAVAAVFLLPISYLSYRKTALPSFSFGLVAKLFFLGLAGFTGQSMGYKGIAYSSPTLGSAMNNLTPAVTFILAVLLRMEKLRLRSASSLAKIVGTTVAIIGALVVVFYRGPVLINMHAIKMPLESPISLQLSDTATDSDWILGGCLLAASYVCVSIWFILLTKILKEYPAQIVVIFFYCICICIIGAPVSLIMDPNLSLWKLKPNIQLISILYTGIIELVFATLVLTWGLNMKGPIYATLFKPLSIAIAAIMGVIFLGDNLYLGSVIGSVIISIGFYTVTWGRTKEETIEKLPEYNVDSPSNSNVPLLKNQIVSTKQDDA